MITFQQKSQDLLILLIKYIINIKETDKITGGTK